jgi:TRAP transporter TAXI family solute receptor
MNSEKLLNSKFVNIGIMGIMVIMLVMGSYVYSDAGTEKKRLAMGTCPARSGMYPWLAAHGTIVNKKIADLSVTVMESPGGVVENQKRINAGQSDFGWGCVCSVWHNIDGTMKWKGNKRDDLRMLAIVIKVPVTWFVRADSGISSLYELEGKPFGTGVPGTVTSAKARGLLESLGISPKLFEAPLGANAQAVKDGRIAGFPKTGAPDSLILEIAARIPIRLLSLSKEDFAKAHTKYPIEFSQRGIIPASSYPGQNEDVFTYADAYGWTTSNRLPEESGYKIVKTWYENRAQLAKMYAAANNSTIGELGFPKLTIDSLKETPIKLHAGAVKFFRELGLSIPDSLIPPEAK